MKIAKRQNDPSGLVSIRRRLGLSQQQLAEQLKINRSTIKFAEQGKRPLPTAALLQVAQLEIMLANEPPVTHHDDPHPAEISALSKCQRSFEQLFAREAGCRIKSQELAGRLQNMRSAYLRTREWLQVIERSMTEIKTDNNTRQWWKKQQLSAIKTLGTCGLPEQVLLKYRIMILEAEAELYRNMNEKLKDELTAFFPGEERPKTEEVIE